MAANIGFACFVVLAFLTALTSYVEAEVVKALK